MRQYRPFLGVILIGLLASGAILAQRWAMEARFRTVEIVLDAADWEALATREGKDPATFLSAARARGATSVGVLERTLKRLAEQGLVAYFATGDLLAAVQGRTLTPEFQALVTRGTIHPRAVYIAAAPEVRDFLEEAYRGLLGSSRVQRVGRLLQIVGTRDDLEELGVGFLPRDLDRYRRLGLNPVLRVRNYDGLTAEGLQSLFQRLRRVGTGYTLVFELQEVLGADQLIRETADAMRADADRYGRIEIFNVRRKQRGEDLLAHDIRPDVIRLFSLTPDELLQLTPDDAADKFVLAARERNIRLLYVRPIIARAGEVGTEANLDYLNGIVEGVQRFGMRVGRAAPLAPLQVPTILFLGVALGALAVLGLGLAIVADTLGASIPARWIWGLIAAGFVVTVGLSISGHVTLWRKLLALAVAAAVPGIGVVETLPRRGGWSAFWQGLRSLWAASVISVLTGVLVAALLSEWEFMLAADQFLGVKVAHVIPVVVVSLLLWARDLPRQTWRQTARELWTWSGRTLMLRHAIIVVVLGLAAGILLGRSGNLGLPVFGPEARLRAATESLLVARPRTKEYLIGHPALVLAAALGGLGWRRWVLPLAAIGAIGQAGIVNSFAHIHTPLLYSAWRTANALILGSALGLLATAVVVAGAVRFRVLGGGGP